MTHGKYVEAEGIVTKYVPLGIHVIYLCGGRGIGKTYGALDLCRKIGTGDYKIDETSECEKFLYLRRTGVEAQSVASPQSCPFKKYNAKEGYCINADFNSKLGFGNFYLDEENETHIGYCAALSTFANLRGIDFSDVTLILYDECIPENKNKHPIKDEGYLLLNMLETINRNRALDGQQEVVLLMLSNPIDLANDLLTQLNLVKPLNGMIFNNQQKYTDKKRSLHIERYINHEISKEKGEKSMLYKFAEGTGFNERSLSGEFLDNDLDLIQKQVNLNEYTPFIVIENVCIYKHKSETLYYVSQVVNKCKLVFSAKEQEKIRKLFYWKYKLIMMDRCIRFDDYSTKCVLESMIRYKSLVG